MKKTITISLELPTLELPNSVKKEPQIKVETTGQPNDLEMLTMLTTTLNGIVGGIIQKANAFNQHLIIKNLVNNE